MPGAGNQVQAAFLDMVRQADPELADRLHIPNQRRPYTVGHLQGFNHLTPVQLEEAKRKQLEVHVTPEQTYWLRLTLLDAEVFGTFARYLIAHPGAVSLRLGHAHFTISRLLSTPEPGSGQQSWVSYASFADLHATRAAVKQYSFEFASPTAFSLGQKQWGKLLHLFPEPSFVFDSLARQWEQYAPSALRMESHGVTPHALASWCGEQVIVTHYALATSYLPSTKYGQAGFQGTITYEVKGSPSAQEAQWLTPLARFALFSGVGYKTPIGMGQARCTSLPGLPGRTAKSKEGQV